MAPTLPDDITRCQDATCPARGRCQRWLERDRSGPWASRAMSLRTMGERAQGPCRAGLLVEENEGPLS